MSEAAGKPPRTLGAQEQASVQGAYTALRANVPGFTARRTQMQMVGAAARALGTERGVVIIEAPTGTGKSLGYLSAAIPLARALDRKVIISTATVALQEQLVSRDIPAFLAATGIPAEVSIAKGRQRYACLRNLFELGAGAEQHALDFGDPEHEPLWPRPPKEGEVKLVQALAASADLGGWDGDMDVPPQAIPDALRPLITTTSGACSGSRCAFFDRCPARLARAKLDQAQVIVANHALVLADLQMPGADGERGGVILPKLSDALLVIDEGHRLAEYAIDAGASHVHLASTQKRVAKWGKTISLAYRLTGAEQLGKQSLPDALKTLEDYLAGLAALQSALEIQWVPQPGDRHATWRAPGGVIPQDWREHAQANTVPCLALAKVLSAAKRSVQEKLKEAGGRSPKLDKLLRDLGMALEALRGQYGLLRAWAELDEPDAPPFARWLGVGTDGGLICHASPITAAPLLRESMWASADGVVLTSATLSAGGDFRSLLRELGLEPETPCMSLPSPFDLAAQATFQVPWMTSMPDQFEAHVRDIVQWLVNELDWNAGSLAIFTSRKKMEAVYAQLPAALQAKTRMQGAAAREQLLREHAQAVQQGQGSLLLGLTSMGEGLDLRGDLATTVLIAQLPFAVPTDPVPATLAEWIQSRGGDPFAELTIPTTIRTLTQYCGRLIRGAQDTGRIVVTDRRLVTRRYGATIVDAMPPFTRQLVRNAPTPAR